MASALSFEEMLAEVVKQDAAKLDIVADTRRMSSRPVRWRSVLAGGWHGGRLPRAVARARRPG
jgi:hypothetical protein